MINEGYVFGFSYFQLKDENNHQWEKQKLIQLLKERYVETYESNLEAYIKWVKNNKIDIKEKDIKEIFKVYDKPITKELKSDYLSSERYKDATFIYRINKNEN